MANETSPPASQQADSVVFLTNGERFLEAFAHVGHRVCGRRMQPFSLRHRFWLEAFESPLVVGGQATILDLEMAAAICAVPFEKLDTVVPRMLRSGPSLFAKVRFAMRCLRSAAGKEYSAWQDYLTDYGCPPAVHGSAKISKGGKRYVALPEILGLVTALIRGSGWDPDRVWSLPPGAAEWYLTGIFMHRGVDMKVKTTHDEEFEAGLMAEKAAAAAKKAADAAAAAAQN